MIAAIQRSGIKGRRSTPKSRSRARVARPVKRVAAASIAEVATVGSTEIGVVFDRNRGGGDRRGGFGGPPRFDRDSNHRVKGTSAAHLGSIATVPRRASSSATIHLVATSTETIAPPQRHSTEAASRMATSGPIRLRSIAPQPARAASVRRGTIAGASSETTVVVGSTVAAIAVRVDAATLRR